MIPRDISVTVHCGPEDDNTPIGSDQVLSDVDLPAASDSRDRRQVLQTQELSPVDWFFRWTVSLGRPENGPDGQQQHSACVQDSTPAIRPWANKPGLSVADISFRWSDQLLCRGWVRRRPCISQRLRCWVNRIPGPLRRSPLRSWGTRRFRCPLIASKRGVHRRCRQMEASLVYRPPPPGFVMCLVGATQQLPGAALLLSLAFDYVSDPFFGAPISFAQCTEVPGSDGPMTLAVYTMPTGASLMSRLGCCTIRRRFGWIGWAKSVPWQRWSTYRGTLALCYRIFRFCHSLLRRYIGCRQR